MSEVHNSGSPNMAGVGAGLAASRSFPAYTATNAMPSITSQRTLQGHNQNAPLVLPDQGDAYEKTQTPISEQDVLLMVQQMRTASSDPNSDSIDTLDLCHKRIESVPHELVALIKDDVIRLALGYNLIRQLPDNFATLASLRYLNIRANNITVFPSCVCDMPNLEILDLSRNKIRALPQEPGRLLALRVLSVNGNRLARLPEWVSKMKQLRILKLDNNPLEWPPPHISKMPIVNLPKPPSSSGSGAVAERDKAKRFEDRQMLVWIAKLRSWINDPANAPHDEVLPSKQQASQSELLALDVDVPPPTVVQPQQLHSSELHNRQDSVGGLSRPRMDTKLLPPLVPMPPPSDGSETSLVSDDSSSGHSTGGAMSSATVPVPSLPPASPSESKLPHTLEPSPLTRNSVTASDSKQHARIYSHPILLDESSPQQIHPKKSLKSKQSLPDLRAGSDTPPETSTADVAESGIAVSTSSSLATPPRPISTVRRQLRHLPGSASMQQTRSTPGANELGAGPNPSATMSSFQALPPSFSANSGGGGGLRKLSLPTVGATQAAAEAAAAALAARSKYVNGSTPPRFETEHARMLPDRADSHWPSGSASPTGPVTRNPADQERNSYFRRLSTLPPSVVAKAAPAPVLKFVDGTRGVLFALSQIHAAISQFMTPVIDERISGQFHRVLDISNGSIINLINSLDRFDSLSRRGTPDSSVIRGVLTTCKESVVTFRKLVSVLQLQLRALQSSSDVRYARTLLLMLVGSMAEVSNSWTAMAPLVEAVQPFLTQQDASESINTVAASTALSDPSHQSARSGNMMIKGANSSSTPSLPSIAESAAPLRPGTRSQIPRGPSRRRHAGSFSAHDLAQGAAMVPYAGNPPPFDLGSLQAASVYNTPATRGTAFHRSESMPSNNVTGISGGHGAGEGAGRGGQSVSGPNTPARPNRSGSNASSTAAVDSVTPRSTPAALNGHRHRASLASVNHLAATTAGSQINAAVPETKIVIDEHLLSMVDQITQLSGQVWSMLFAHLRSTGIHGADTDALSAATSSNDDADKAIQATSGESLKNSDDAKLDAAQSEATREKLHELREMAHNTDELTMQLRSTYLVVRQEEQQQPQESQHERQNSTSPPSVVGDPSTKTSQAAIAKLFEESHLFVRAIVGTSTLMKAISETHEFPRDLRRSLGEIAQACSNLTVYLLWLSPPSHT